MTQDEIIRMARELVKIHGVRMCDENGDTHGEELYCVGVDDIAEIIKQTFNEGAEYALKRIAFRDGDAYPDEVREEMGLTK